MESPHRTLSKRVQDYINALHQEIKSDLQSDELTIFEQARNMIDTVVDNLIASRETVANNKLASIEKLVQSKPGMIESFLDERFTRKLVEGVSGNVSRFLRLSRMEALSIPSPTTNGYLREADRSPARVKRAGVGSNH